jgi:hypothetical protein
MNARKGNPWMMTATLTCFFVGWVFTRGANLQKV